MIHKYKLNGFNIVLDINSGGVHIVDDITYDILNLISGNLEKECPNDILLKLSEAYLESEIISSYNEIISLYDDQSLFTTDEYHTIMSKISSSPIKAMCLHVAHDCNLRCTYCFASTGDFGTGRKIMTIETAKNAIDYLLYHSKGRRNLEVDFFGGEPLMNMNVVKETVSYARSKEKEYNKVFRFTMTTNGILLNDDNTKFINDEMSNAVLSIDGRKEINDKLRPRVDGSGCYDSIIDKYKKLVDTRGLKDYYIRGTFTKYNLDFAKDVIHLNDYGFVHISVEPVVSEEDKDYAITTKDLPIVCNEYEKLSLEIIKRKKEGKEINFFHFYIDLEQGPCAIKRIRGCGCGNEYIAITPDDEIYPCHQFVGKKDWIIGNLNDGLKIDEEKKDFFTKTTIYHKPECSTCWARLYCSGGCSANNVEYQKDILQPNHIYCTLQKKRIECAIMIKAALA
ncbi:MAG: thioether cross-link-forming SCIFF peptide maturase [Oscillospiraceae bacterium]|nr:thioether cross-link-forming SCIFF peptide maturase [Oscillospiraceae bacterium]